MKNRVGQLMLIFIALAAAGIAPNLFVAAQAGYALLSDLAIHFLLPSIGILVLVWLFARWKGMQNLARPIEIGFLGGLLGTVGLEVVRHVGFLLGGMPGEMPKLMGVLLLNRFALGPNALSNLAGWSYHFWNGAAFGIIYSLLFGRGKVWWGILYGILIGIGFMAGPAAIALGVGRFGTEFGPGFPITVTLAHVAFGSILGSFIHRYNTSAISLLQRLKNLKTVAANPLVAK